MQIIKTEAKLTFNPKFCKFIRIFKPLSENNKINPRYKQSTLITAYRTNNSQFCFAELLNIKSAQPQLRLYVSEIDIIIIN